MDDAPPTIFKYEPFSLRAVQNLKAHSVYFNSPSSFNDPFDCALSPRIKEPTDIEVNAIAGRLMAKPEHQHLVEQLANTSPKALKAQIMQGGEQMIRDQCDDFNKSKGVTCFSECNDNMLMWSHYGGQHRGFCLEFDTAHEPFTKLRRVEYSATVPTIDLTDFMLGDNYDHLLNLFCTKSIDWKYEREWRALHAEAGTLFTYTAEALKAIYFGAKMSKQDIDMICLILHGQNPDVKLYRGDRSDSDFKIEFTHFTYTPNADAKRKGLV